MYSIRILFLSLFLTVILFSCNKDEDNNPVYLVFKYTFDEDQARLDNFGNPISVPNGHAAQDPVFHALGVHSIELLPSAFTLPSEGTIIYSGEETFAGGDKAIDFELEKKVSDGEVLLRIPIQDITPGNYPYLRNSLAYQEYDIEYVYNDSSANLSLTETARVASFIGYNTYLKTITVDQQEIPIDDNRTQGFWAFSSEVAGLVVVDSGQAPGTTVPNILSDTSPIPSNSCLVTGAFSEPLTITGNESNDVVVTISVSINNSFEWEEIQLDGLYEPAIGETVVDMGVRGIIPSIQY